MEISAFVGGIDIEASDYVRQQYLKSNDFRNFFGFREKQHLLQGAKDLIILILNRSAVGSYIGQLIKSMLLQSTQSKRSTNSHD